MHATISTLRENVSEDTFRESARNAKDSHGASSRWKDVAANHWPEPLAYIEHILAISMLETYAQGIVFSLYMAKEGISYQEYSSDWECYKKKFRNRKPRSSTQNIRSLVKHLKKEYKIEISLEEKELVYLQKANDKRNKIIHTSGHENLASPSYQENWNIPSSASKLFFGDYEVGELPSRVYAAIKEIDKCVISSGALPKTVLMHSSEIEDG